MYLIIPFLLKIKKCILAKLYNNIGVAYLDTGDYIKSEEYLITSIEEVPEAAAEKKEIDSSEVPEDEYSHGF